MHPLHSQPDSPLDVSSQQKWEQIVGGRRLPEKIVRGRRPPASPLDYTPGHDIYEYIFNICIIVFR